MATASQYTRKTLDLKTMLKYLLKKALSLMNFDSMIGKSLAIQLP